MCLKIIQNTLKVTVSVLKSIILVSVCFTSKIFFEYWALILRHIWVNKVSAITNQSWVYALLSIVYYSTCPTLIIRITAINDLPLRTCTRFTRPTKKIVRRERVLPRKTSWFNSIEFLMFLKSHLAGRNVCRSQRIRSFLQFWAWLTISWNKRVKEPSTTASLYYYLV